MIENTNFNEIEDISQTASRKRINYFQLPEANVNTISKLSNLSFNLKRLGSRDPSEILNALNELKLCACEPISTTSITTHSVQKLVQLFQQSNFQIQLGIVGFVRDLISKNPTFVSLFVESSFHLIIYECAKDEKTNFTLLNAFPLLTEFIRYSEIVYFSLAEILNDNKLPQLIGDIMNFISKRTPYEEPYHFLAVFVGQQAFPRLISLLTKKNPKFLSDLTEKICSALFFHPVDSTPYISSLFTVLTYISTLPDGELICDEPHKSIELMEKFAVAAAASEFITNNISLQEVAASACHFLSALTYRSDKACFQLNTINFIEKKVDFIYGLSCSTDFLRIVSNCMMVVVGLDKDLVWDYIKDDQEGETHSISDNMNVDQDSDQDVDRDLPSKVPLYSKVIAPCIEKGNANEKEIAFYVLAMISQGVPPEKLGQFLMPISIIPLMKQLLEGGFKLGSRASYCLLEIAKDAYSKAPQENEEMIKAFCCDSELCDLFVEFFRNDEDGNSQQYSVLLQWMEYMSENLL